MGTGEWMCTLLPALPESPFLLILIPSSSSCDVLLHKPSHVHVSTAYKVHQYNRNNRHEWILNMHFCDEKIHSASCFVCKIGSNFCVVYTLYIHMIMYNTIMFLHINYIGYNSTSLA